MSSESEPIGPTIQTEKQSVAVDPDTDLRRCDLVAGCPFEGTWAEWLAHAVDHPLPHPDDRDAWLQARRTFVGASEVAAICGLNPYDSALDVWAAKVRGESKRKPHLEGRATARLGHLMEPELLKDYAARHGCTLVRPASKRHPLYPWAGATPDGDASTGELVQVKLVGANMLHHWSDGPPRYVLLQVQYELFVWQRERCVILAGLGGTDIEEYPVTRDEQTIESARQLVELFWTQTVVPRQLPQDFDGAVSDDTLRLLFPKLRAPLRKATSDEIALVLDYTAAGERIKPLKEEKERIGGLIKLAIGEAEGFEWPGGKATWKPTKGSLDEAALSQALLERFVADPAARQSWIDRFTAKAGERRIYTHVKSTTKK